MRRAFFFVFLYFSSALVYGADSLQINISNTHFVNGDTLEFRCSIPGFAGLKLSSATLNVWIEDVQRSRRWKFRYPIINGEVSAALAISDKIADGRYAVNFLVQHGFFKVLGQVQDHDKKDTGLVYMMIPKNRKGSYFDNIRVQPDGSFRLKSTLFADSAFFIFSPARKVRNNDLSIQIETPLDSAFIPVLRETKFITIGNPGMLLLKNTDTSHYVFSFAGLPDVNLLPEVTVTSKFKSKMEQYDDEYSSALFRRDDALVFDGLESDALSRSASVMMFLQGRVPGLTIEKTPEGLDVAKWRNEVAEIYVDEFRLEPSDHTFISPAEVAMIKVFRPPAQLSAFSGAAGAIAIYTRRGIFAGTNKSKHNFVVKGYTNVDSSWE